MADDVEKLVRGSVRSSLNQASTLLAYTVPSVFFSDTYKLNRREFDFGGSDVLPYPEPAVIQGVANRLDRSLVKDSGLLAYMVPVVFNAEAIPATRIGLPVISETDEAQLIIRGESFDLDFAAEPLRGLPPLTVQFENNSQSPINSWLWDFGDGNTSTDENPIHVYLEEGEYDVKLTSGSEIFGYSSVTKYGYINVGLEVIIDPMSGKAPLKVRFRVDESLFN